MPQQIFISAIQTISALGSHKKEVWDSYQGGTPRFTRQSLEADAPEEWMSVLPPEEQAALTALMTRRPQYEQLDRTVLMAMLAAERMAKKLGRPLENTGVNIGSSRGATALFEKYHANFIRDGRASAYTSPTTTLGNLSSWTAQHLGLDGAAIDQSVTCSTGMHAVLNGIAWIRAGMSQQFIAGGVEAALTPFTLAQMKALRLYSECPNTLACESMRFEKKANTMVLGEGAGVLVLEGRRSVSAIAQIAGFGYATEPLRSLSSISADASCLQLSMNRALESAGLETVDALVMHAPGTVKGDLAEKNAIESVFGSRLPLLTSNKWIVGHTFAASGVLSMEMAVMMLEHDRFLENPFYANARHLPGQIRTVMVNAVGFGGNAVSIILSKA